MKCCSFTAPMCASRTLTKSANSADSALHDLENVLWCPGAGYRADEVLAAREFGVRRLRLSKR